MCKTKLKTKVVAVENESDGRVERGGGGRRGGGGGQGGATLENMNRNLTVFTGQTPGNFAWELRDLFERASVWSTVSRTNGPNGPSVPDTRPIYRPGQSALLCLGGDSLAPRMKSSVCMLPALREDGE